MLFFTNWDIESILLAIRETEWWYDPLSWKLSFVLAMWILAKMLTREQLDFRILAPASIYAYFSAIAGARLGYCFFYDTETYTNDPLRVLNPLDSGFSAFGAAFGLFIGLWFFSHNNKLKYSWALDHAAVLLSLSGAIVQIGNTKKGDDYRIKNT